MTAPGEHDHGHDDDGYLPIHIPAGTAPAYLDIGPIAGERLLHALLTAIGNAGPAGRTTIITNGDRPLAVLVPPTERK